MHAFIYSSDVRIDYLLKTAYISSIHKITSTSVSVTEIHIRYILSLNGSPSLCH
jgi:hypothetical protein